jgi:hypothetical protein
MAFSLRAEHNITLKLSNKENLIIVNIYGVRTSNERALMWKWLSETNFDTSHVIIKGDFNQLEETDRRGKTGERFMMRRKVAFWHHMMLQYGLADAWKLDSF